MNNMNLKQLNKKTIIIFLLFIGIFVVLFILVLTNNQKKTSTPTPTPLAPIGSSSPGLPPFSPQPLRSQERFRFIINRKAVSIKWLNNDELAYLVYHPRTKEIVVAKVGTDSIERELYKNESFNFAEVRWSANNQLLIYNYGEQPKTYILRDFQNIEELPLSGYAYSWGPDNAQIGYASINNNISYFSIYSTSTKQSAASTQLSFSPASTIWSPKGDSILLYYKNYETGLGGLFSYPIQNKQATYIPVPESVVKPSWSPDGDQIGYISNNGISVYSQTSGDRRIYQSSNPSNLSYAWVNNSLLLVIDTSLSSNQIKLVDINTQRVIDYEQNLFFQPNQTIEIALSPNGSTVALASEKDGLWFLNNR